MATSGHTFLVVQAILFAFCIAAVGLRVFVRVKLVNVFGPDDWLMVLSLLVYTAMSAFVFVGVKYGIGQHNADLSIGNMIEALKYLRLIQLSYLVLVGIVKLSIGFFLLRIAVQKNHKLIVHGSMILSTCFCVISFFYVLFQCKPIQAAWTPTIKNPTCTSPKNFTKLGYVFSAMTIVVDWIFALIPVFMLWNVKMSFQMKLSVVLLLGLGVFTSTAPLIRLKSVVTLNDEADILYSFMEALLWTCIEPGLGIITACMATFRPLVRFLHVDGFSSGSDKKNTFLGGSNAAGSRHLTANGGQELNSWVDSKRTGGSQLSGRPDVDDLNGSTESIIHKSGIIKTVEFGTEIHNPDLESGTRKL